ncbi:hypothetical protein P775_14925 [Puniceibacterium antarcticum]|uniref:Component of SufBCD complex n=1 Tax=Puniceibacterium antarcticum TaxID=1206336 RepID=A0A2G8RDD1_9RHOB|nr:component of SufBCD complex [Puniceibacterium antarcticum]PIL19431.1 hypothetical protein P775_14925 [Puniceibacterium antarcticum]
MVFEVIDMQSFSSLWFWIALAAVWSSVSHWVLGVPFDMVTRARHLGGQAEADLEHLARIHIERSLRTVEESGLWLMAFGCFLLAGLGLLAFVYWIELAQALFFLGFPLVLVWILSLRTAHRIRSEAAAGALLCKRLTHLRYVTQAIGLLSLFVTSLWGMYSNLSAGFLG